MQNDPYLLASSDVIVREEGDEGEALLFDPETGRIKVLNRTGLLLWEWCDGAHTRADLVAGLAAEYPEVEKLEKKFAQEVDQLLGAQEIPYKAVLLVGAGSAGDQIVRRLERTQSQAICLGIMRRSKMGKLLFGSTAQYVILNAPCPVVSIR